VHQRDRESFRAAILGVLHPHSTLRSLKLYHSGGFETDEDFARLFTAVEKSPLQSLSVGRLVSGESCMALIAIIPKMQLRTLEVHLNRDLQYMTRDFVGAVKRNASLGSVVAKLDNRDDLFENDDRKKLTSYCERNQFFAQWMENPTAVSKAAWPEYLDVAQTTGPDTIFCILGSLAPSLGPFEGEQMPKAPPSRSLRAILVICGCVKCCLARTT
jgi:hypothetical protein